MDLDDRPDENYRGNMYLPAFESHVGILVLDDMLRFRLSLNRRTSNNDQPSCKPAKKVMAKFKDAASWNEGRFDKTPETNSLARARHNMDVSLNPWMNGVQSLA